MKKMTSLLLATLMLLAGFDAAFAIDSSRNASSLNNSGNTTTGGGNAQGVSNRPIGKVRKFTTLEQLSGNPVVELAIATRDLALDLLKRDNAIFRVRDARQLVKTNENTGSIGLNIFEVADDGTRELISSQRIAIGTTRRSRKIFFSQDLGRFDSLNPTKNLELEVENTDRSIAGTYKVTINAINPQGQVASVIQEDFSCDGLTTENCIREFLIKKVDVVPDPTRNRAATVVNNEFTDNIEIKVPVVRRFVKFRAGRRNLNVNSSTSNSGTDGGGTGGGVASFGETLDISRIRLGDSSADFANFRYDPTGGVNNGHFILSSGVNGNPVSDNFFFADTGKLGIGLRPEAFLDVRGGTATMPQMRLNNGSLTTTPVNGALEFDGSELYFTKGGVRAPLGSNSTFNNVTINNGTVNNTNINNGTVTNITINNGNVNNVTINDSTFNNGDITNSNITDNTINNNTVNGTLTFTNNGSIEGDLVVNGMVTATKFMGDGSMLTNIPASAINGTVASNATKLVSPDGSPDPAVSVDNNGNVAVEAGDFVVNGMVTATKFIGDGSMLTGIAANDIVNGTVTNSTITGGVINGATLVNTNVVNGNVVSDKLSSPDGTINPAVAVDNNGDVTVTEGNLVVNGMVTATKFIGDGSMLTGISSNSIVNGTVTNSTITGGVINGATLVNTNVVNGNIVSDRLSSPDGTINPAVAVDNNGDVTVTEGDLTVNGMVTADKFMGDGSMLTNIPASAINGSVASDATKLVSPDGSPDPAVSVDNNGNVAVEAGDLTVNGMVTADKFMGDGSMLTNLAVNNGSVTNTTINNGSVTNSTFNNGDITNSNITNNTINNNVVNGTLTFTNNGSIDGDLVVNGMVTATKFMGDGSMLTNLTGANVNGQVASAATADLATTATQAVNAQNVAAGTITDSTITNSNITGGMINGSVLKNVTIPPGSNIMVSKVSSPDGTITALEADNNGDVEIGEGDLTVNGMVTADKFMGDGSMLTNLTGANVTGTVANATNAVNAQNAVTAQSASTATSAINADNATTANFADAAGSVAGGSVNNTNIDNSTITNSTIDNSTINNSTVNGTITFTNNSMIDGDVTVNGMVTATKFMGDGSMLTNVAASSALNAVNADNATTANFADQAANATNAVNAQNAVNASNVNAGTITNSNMTGGMINGTVLKNVTIPPGSSIMVSKISSPDGVITALEADNNGDIFITEGDVTVTEDVIANKFIGDGSMLTNVAADTALNAVNADNATTANLADVATLAINADNATTANFADAAGSVAGGNISNTTIEDSTLTGTTTVDGMLTFTNNGFIKDDVKIDGSLEVDSEVTANKFIGDGSMLTNVAADTALNAVNAENATTANLADVATLAINADNATTANFADAAASVAGGNVSNTTIDNSSITNSTIDDSTINNNTVNGTLTFTNTAEIEGDVTVNGMVTATKFMGDGSMLTNLTGANVTGAVTNAINAQNAVNATNSVNAQNMTGGTVTNSTISNSTITNGIINGTTLVNVTIPAGSNVNTSKLVSPDGNIDPAVVVDNAGNVEVTVGDLTVNGEVTADKFTGDGSMLTNLTGANVTGTVANAANATNATNAQNAVNATNSVNAQNMTAGTVTNSTITNGVINGATLVNVSIPAGSNIMVSKVSSPDGNITALEADNNGDVEIGEGDLTVNGTVTAEKFMGDGSMLTNLTGANVTGQVASAANADNATNANNAQNAVNSQNAVNATNAVNAQNAVNATNATNAQNVNAGTVTNSTITNGVINGATLVNVSIPGGSDITVSKLVSPDGSPNPAVAVDNDGNVEVTEGDLTVNGMVTAEKFMGDGSMLTNLTGANVTGQVASAANADNATTADNATNAVNAQNVTGGNVTNSTITNGLINGATLVNVNIPGNPNINLSKLVAPDGDPNPALSIDNDGDATFVGDIQGMAANFAKDVGAWTFRARDGIFVRDNHRIHYSTLGTRFNMRQFGIGDFKISGQNDENLFFADYSEDNIGIGLMSPTEKLVVNGNVAADKFIGDGSMLTNVTADNAQNAVNAQNATNAQNVTGGNITNSNITNGLINGATLINVNIPGNPNIILSKLVAPDGNPDPALEVNNDGDVEITEGDLTVNGMVTADKFMGDGSMLTNLSGANVTGQVASAANADNATNATNAQNAVNAQTAQNAVNAQNAANAVQAQNAVVAQTAANAAQADNATNADNVNGGNITNSTITNGVINGANLINVNINNSNVKTARLYDPALASTVVRTALSNIGSNVITTVPDPTGWSQFRIDEKVLNAPDTQKWAFGSTGDTRPDNNGGPNSFYLFQYTDRADADVREYRLIVKDDGKIGIGRVNPTERLDVNGNVKAIKFIGDGSMLTNINATNIVGSVPNATNAVNAQNADRADFSLEAIRLRSPDGQINPVVSVNNAGVTTVTGKLNGMDAYFQKDINAWNVTGRDGVFVRDNHRIHVNSGAHFNIQKKAGSDFRVSGNNDNNMIFGDASADMVGIGDATPEVKLDVNGAIRPRWDARACSDALRGAIRYHVGKSLLQFCNGTDWTDIGASNGGGGGNNGPSDNGGCAADGYYHVTAGEVSNGGTNKGYGTGPSRANFVQCDKVSYVDRGHSLTRTWSFPSPPRSGRVIFRTIRDRNGQSTGLGTWYWFADNIIVTNLNPRPNNGGRSMHEGRRYAVNTFTCDYDKPTNRFTCTVAR